MPRAEVYNERTMRLETNGGTTVRPSLGQGAQGLPGPGSAAWAALTAVTSGAVRQAPDGSWIKSTANRTTRASFDATEETFWTAVLGTDGTVEATALSAAIDAEVLINRTATMHLRKEVTPSGSNDTAAVNTALAAFAAAGGGKVVIPRDNWVFTGSTSIGVVGTSSPLHLEFEDGAEWDMTGMTTNNPIRFGGSITATSAALGADVAKGAVTVTCATVAAAVVSGDIIKISSTDLFETLSSVVKGEFAEVLSVAGSVITLKSMLWDSYTAATSTVTKMQMPKVSMEGRASLLWNRDLAVGVEIYCARDVSLGGLYGQGARLSLFELDHVYGATADNMTGRDFWYTGTGNSYGLIVGASQHIREIGLDFRGGRHAVAHGGNMPTRDVQTIGGTFDSYHPSAMACFDYHGGVESCTLMGATLLNGLNLQGSNIYVGGGTRIKGQSRQAVEIGPARSCDFIKIENTDVETMGAFDGIQYLPRNAAVATTLGLLKIDATIRAGAAGVRVTPAGATHTGATIDRLVVRGDITAGGASSAIEIGKSTAAYVGINKAEFDGRFRAPGGPGVVLAGTSTGPATFRGEYQTDVTGQRPINMTMFGNVYVHGAILKGTVTPFRSLFENTGGLYLYDAVIDGAFTNAFDADTNVTEVLQSNVQRINGAGAPLLPGRHFSHIDGAGKVTTQGTAAPTTGAWNVGDRCWNTAAAAAGVPGWICTTAGTPGTWKAMAVVAA